jgi:hypothetical protein
MSKSSTSVTRKAMKLDNKVKAINLCDGGKSCQVVAEEMGDGHTQIMNMRFSTILKIMFPVQENVNVMLLEMRTLRKL